MLDKNSVVAIFDQHTRAKAILSASGASETQLHLADAPVAARA
jgi:hypothetical protein